MSKDIVIIKVASICGPHCVGVEDGESLFKKVLSIFEEGVNKVTLDFTDILTITSSFLNASIGKLFLQLKEEEFNNRVNWQSSDASDSQLISLVIRNAKEHLKKSDEMKKTEDSITKRVLDKE